MNDCYIFSKKEENSLKALYLNALHRYHNLKAELKRKIEYNENETRKSKRVPVTLLKKQVNSSLKDVETTKRAYSNFNLSDYTFKKIVPRQFVEKSEDEEYADGISFDTKIFDINDEQFKEQSEWTAWPEESECVDFVSVMKGIGDGEQRLAYVFGGSIMGGNKSYDLIIKDSGKWEVKDITGGNDVRPGHANCSRMYAKMYIRLASIIEQINNFMLAFSGDFSDMSERDQRRLSYVSDFVSSNYYVFIDGGEIPKPRFLELKKAIEYLSAIKKQAKKSSHKILTEDFFVESIDRSTYVSVMKTLCAELTTTFSEFSKLDLALDFLRDKVFDDPSEVVTIVSELRSSKIFGEHVDGMIFVHKEKGFFVVRREKMDDLVVFDNVTQSKPKFKFLLR